MGRSAASFCAPPSRLSKTRLEVDASDELHQTSRRIVCRRVVTISLSQLSESRATDAQDIDVIPWIADDEVDVVEGIQELCAELEVHALSDLDLLDRAQIEPGEARPVEHYMREALLAVKSHRVVKVRWSDVAASGRAGKAAERPPRVVNEVLWQVVGDLVRLLTNFDRVLKLAQRQIDQLDVAEVERRAALKARRPMELPAANDTVKGATRIPEQHL